METLLVFLAIAAIQMLAAYAKQKKEAAKKASAPIPEPFREEEEDEDEEFEPPHHASAEHHAGHPVSYADTPLKEGNFAQRNFQFNLKDPAQGIIWTAILSEPRYKVKWKQR